MLDIIGLIVFISRDTSKKKQGGQMRILTENGVIYTVDVHNRIIIGGEFRVPTKYVSARLIVGMEGLITLPNGQQVITAIITSYL